MLPAQVSSVIFGGTESKYVLSKIGIMAGESLLRLQVAALAISLIVI